MIFAQIKSGVIVNVINLDDPSIVDLFSFDPATNIPYDHVLQIDQLYPRPGIGWLFDELIFTSAVDPGQFEGSKDPTPPGQDG